MDGCGYDPSVAGRVIIGLALPPLMGWVLYNLLSPARAIWRGEASRVPVVPGIRPSQRAYVPYLLWTTPFFGGIGLVGVAILLFTLFTGSWAGLVFGIPGFGLMLVVAPPFMLVHLIACLFNRPRFLITPTCRHEPGWVQTIWHWLRRSGGDAAGRR
ncbi:hypothetical protein ACFFX1_42675 [Dactylosporangium sucinum]|uniref:Uncharacterized protein n=1 Tax=Dactylosporangium sucinum TaxID=1424081 RepID=A0A917U6Z2_9ACTN|nr:hypothetical protein [Dactylosporangium sucinum]GGM63057.1 hypothetical protein GCM10007977_075820 [Dactylosporangium sucinum]